jgi:beta-glucosidase
LTPATRLHRKVYSVQFKLQNVGMLTGAEIPQLYLSFPASTNSPPRVLRGFDSVLLTAGETQDVEFKLSRYDLSIWNVEQQAWVAPEAGATIGVHVGASSRDLRLQGTITL